jgi:hypothetical protein
MIKIKINRYIFLVLTCTTIIAAQEFDYVASKAKVMDSLNVELLACELKSANIAKLTIPVLDELSELASSLPAGNNKAVGELMNPEQANKFGRLAQKEQFYTAQAMFISKRSRDIGVVQELAERLISEFEQTKFNSGDLRTEEQKKMLTATLVLIGNMVKQNTKFVLDIKTVNDGVDGSMTELSNAIDKMLNSRGARLKTFQSLIEKRRGSKFQVAELTFEEKKEYNEVEAPLIRALDAQVRLVGLRVFYTVLTLDNKWAIDEIISSAGDLDSIGKKMNEFRDGSSEEIKLLIDLGRAINEKIPCVWVKQMEQHKNNSRQ